MALFSFPHIFKDGVGETASGAQVMEDLNLLKGRLEPEGKPGARAERALSTPLTPSASQNTMVYGDVSLSPTTGFGAIATVKLGGVVVQELFAGEHVNESIRVPFTLWVPAGMTWEVVKVTANISSLHASYQSTY